MFQRLSGYSSSSMHRTGSSDVVEAPQPPLSTQTLSADIDPRNCCRNAIPEQETNIAGEKERTARGLRPAHVHETNALTTQEQRWYVTQTFFVEEAQPPELRRGTPLVAPSFYF